MSTVRKVSLIDYKQLSLYVLDLPSLDVSTNSFKEITGHFIVCLALDGSQVADAEIQAFASTLIKAGCSYFCCWGPECERVHDQIDAANLAISPDGPWAMTTWHDGVPLSEALWCSFNSSWPDPAFEDTTHSAVGISINNQAWATEINSAFSDPIQFNRNVLSN